MNNTIEACSEKNMSKTIAKIYKKYGILLILLVLIAVSAILNPAFFTINNLTNVFRQIVVVMIIACGAQLIIISGNIDLSAGSVVGLSGVIGADIMVKTNSLILAVLAGLLIGLACGWLNGFIITKLSIPAFIMTLAMQTIVRGIIFVYTDAVPISNLGDFTLIGQGYIGPIPIPVIIMVIILILTWVLLNKRKTGRYLYAVGGNSNAAKASGINVSKIRLFAFLYGGLMAGLAGIILTSRMNSGQPLSGQNLEFDAITAVIIGGTSLSGGVGKLSGTVFGGLLIGFLGNIMNLQGVSSYYQQIVQGVIIALAVIVDVRVRSAMQK
ncbi:MAG: ABC transporter permease [Christensenellales bacterium]|jgi:inositol transport system permease protein